MSAELIDALVSMKEKEAVDMARNLLDGVTKALKKKDGRSH